MYKIFLIIALIVSSFIQAQVSTTRINDVKLGMKLSDLEKETGQHFRVKLDGNGYPEKTTLIINGIKYRVDLSKNENYPKTYIIDAIKASDVSLKTLSGIKVGSSLDELFSKYKNLNISITDGYDRDTGKRSKEFRFFNIEDNDSGTILQFYLINNKVAYFYLYYNEGC